MKNMRVLVTLLFGAIGLGDVNFAQTADRPDNSQKDRTLREGEQESRVTVVEFKAGDSQLSGESKEKIKSFVDRVRAGGGLKEIEIAVWSDQKSSAESTKDLPKQDRQLAELRGKNLENFLKNELDVKQIDVINMAESTSWVAKKLNTEASSLKQIFSEEGFKGKVSQEALLIRDHGKPSSAVLVAIHGREKEAH